MMVVIVGVKGRQMKKNWSQNLVVVTVGVRGADMTNKRMKMVMLVTMSLKVPQLKMDVRKSTVVTKN